FPGTSQNVFWDVLGTAPHRELVIQWNDVSRASGCTDSTATNTFQAVFFEDNSQFLTNYKDVTFGGPPACAAGDYGALATVGVQLTYPSATQFSYKTPSLTDHLSLLWTLR